jgi:hypothetical protein
MFTRGEDVPLLEIDVVIPDVADTDMLIFC